MPKKKAEVIGTVEAPEVEVTTSAIEPVSVEAEAKTSFDVHNSSGALVRTYSLEDQGPDAEKLAHQYASKIGGSVK